MLMLMIHELQDNLSSRIRTSNAKIPRQLPVLKMRSRLLANHRL